MNGTRTFRRGQKKFPKKLYEVIPRKCYVDIPGADENILKESEIVIDKYYCLCNCPHVLKTINTMKDAQLAGISRSKVQWFNNDTKLVQLMRFYYAMSSLLSSRNKDEIGKKARLLLFNGNLLRYVTNNSVDTSDSDKKLSNVLLQAIKEDVHGDSSNQKPDGSLMENKLLSAEERIDILYDFDAL
ncbi:unnamed protein product [Mytilus edulis]|uniref:Uncharacterized protein n=1 Tax=Mytilus edulis TaxID=6550 RepID=A0A8S3T9N3_MYTED|nr:unnamed protein product [Mytilus edulis]